MTNTYSCIIPAYNENLRLVEVLKVVSKVDEISEIICCLDGNQNDKIIEIIKKQSLINALQISKTNGYQLEIAQNKYLIKHNKKVTFMDISAKNVGKVRKFGLLSGLAQETGRWKQVIDYAGIIFLIKQSFFFTRKELKS